MNYELRIKKRKKACPAKPWRSGGYTIIETMIAVSLFIIIIMSGMGALLNANLLHQKSHNLRSIIDNLSFIMEDMSRNLRTGYHFRCLVGNDNLSDVSTPLSCQSGWGVAFEPATGDPSDAADQWIYYVNPAGQIFRSTEGPAAGNFFQITPPEVVIDQLFPFAVLGAEPPASNKQQPFVGIKLVGKIIFKNVITPFALQTSISQRLVDI